MHSLVGIGLRQPHYQQILAEKPAISLLEIHTENFLMEGGPSLEFLSSLHRHYPLSFHGIGLSLGSAELPQKDSLKRVKNLFSRYEPFLISEHLSWNKIGRTTLPDRLPLPYNQESLRVFSENLDFSQNYLQRTILIENPATYLEFRESTYTEVEFLISLAKQTGAKILVDVNNIYVSCTNHHRNPFEYLKKIPAHLIGEIHLAGHAIKKIDEKNSLCIDTHDTFVSKEVWQLYHYLIKNIYSDLAGLPATLVEWDANIPSLATLIAEANKALHYLPNCKERLEYGNA